MNAFTRTAGILVLLVACGPAGDGADTVPGAAPGMVAGPQAPQDEFWHNLQALCEGAAAGRLLQAPPGDTQIDPEAPLVVHFRECTEEELRFPLHVADNRSRTWVFIRHDDSLELRHDHRHPDGTEESNTWYGASTMDEGTATRQEFVSERNGMLSGWRVEIEPGQRYTYGTIRDGEWRHHLEFDLTQPVQAPPPPWGHETRPSQRPSPSGAAAQESGAAGGA
jgi:hypothetical protein